MSLTVDIQCASNEPVPDEADLHHWIAAALSSQRGPTDTEISVRLIDIDEMASLNQEYRGKTGPTNVLSFPAKPARAPKTAPAGRTSSSVHRW